MEPNPKMSSVPKPARKSLEPSPAAWTRNLPQTYSKYRCQLGDSFRSRCDRRCDRFGRCDTYRSGGGGGAGGGL